MLSADCMSCLVLRQLRMLNEYNDEEKKALYMKEVFGILSNMEKGAASPVAVERMDRLFKKYFGKLRCFDEVKRKYNEIILEKEDEIYRIVSDSSDSLLCALKYSRIGNYIDFGALSSVEDKKLTDLIYSAPDDYLDPEEYRIFKSEIEKAEKMVLITDNCGEIVFDKILVRTIRRLFPDLKLNVLVRGAPVLNDATLEDAVFVGIDKYAPITENGSGIAGTYIPDISETAKQLLSDADLILAKGQGNFETMFGCGLNVYYAFLCKCVWFEKRFCMKKLEGIFTNDRRSKFKAETSSV